MKKTIVPQRSTREEEYCKRDSFLKKDTYFFWNQLILVGNRDYQQVEIRFSRQFCYLKQIMVKKIKARL